MNKFELHRIEKSSSVPSIWSMTIFSQADWYVVSIFFGILPPLGREKTKKKQSLPCKLGNLAQRKYYDGKKKPFIYDSIKLHSVTTTV